MDLLETTLKVIENRSVAKESLTLFKQDLDQYENYISQLTDNLQETQSVSSKSTEILEINNFTKTTFNENAKEAKLLFGTIYGYAKQIRENICNISQSENSLLELCSENEERLKRIDTNFNNSFKMFEIMKKDLTDEAVKESGEIQDEISRLEAEYKACDSTWKDIVDQHEEKQRTLQAIKMETEILEDDIDLEIQQQELLMQEKKQENRKKVEEINCDAELRDKIIETKEAIMATNKKLQEILESKSETLQRLNESQATLDQINVEHAKVEHENQEFERNMKEEMENLKSEIGLKQDLMNEKDLKTSAYKSKECALNNDMEEINSKMDALVQELGTIQREFTENESALSENDTLEKMLEAQDKFVQNSEKLSTLIAANEVEIQTKQAELDLLKSSPHPELLEFQEKINALEVDIPRKAVAEKELEEIDSSNKTLQQTVGRHQKMIQDLLEEKQKAEVEHKAQQEDLRNIALQYEDMVKEVRCLESLNEKKRQILKGKTFLKPTPQPIKSPAQTKSGNKRRRIIADVESDSSADGERLSYAEFMAKKKMMKDNKRQKRYGRAVDIYEK